MCNIRLDHEEAWSKYEFTLEYGLAWELSIDDVFIITLLEHETENTQIKARKIKGKTNQGKQNYKHWVISSSNF